MGRMMSVTNEHGLGLCSGIPPQKSKAHFSQKPREMGHPGLVHSRPKPMTDEGADLKGGYKSKLSAGAPFLAFSARSGAFGVASRAIQLRVDG